MVPEAMNPESPSPSYEIVIIGGGTAGITVASRILNRASRTRLALIEPSENHYYQPLWTLVGGGVVPKNKTVRPEASVIPRGADWIRDRVVSVAPNENRVVTESGRTLTYAFLVVAAGIRPLWNRVKGLAETLGKNGVCSNFAFETTDKTWEFLREFRRGNAIFTYPNTETRCGGAPQKILWLADHFLRKQGRRENTQLLFVSPKPAIFGVPHYARTLQRLVAERNIVTRFRSHLVEVQGDRREAVIEHLESGELETIPYEFLHVTPPQGPPEFIGESGLGDEDGYADTDPYTLQHKKYSNVFALGDAANLPTAKTGAAIRKQAPVLVENLLAQKAGQSLPARYDGYTACPLITGYGRLILAEFDYDGHPKETFPFDQSRERWSLYLLKKYLLPILYWNFMLKGRA